MIRDKILITDLETTGFNSKHDCIVEVGFASLDLSNGKIEILFDNFICEDHLTPDKLEGSWIIQNSDIKVADVLTAKNLEHYRDEIQGILNEFVLGITAYNRDFDLRFLDARGFRYWKELADPMEIATYVCKIPGKRGLKQPKMPEAYNKLFPGSNFQESHRAGKDCYHEAEIIYLLYQLGWFKI